MNWGKNIYNNNNNDDDNAHYRRQKACLSKNVKKRSKKRVYVCDRAQWRLGARDLKQKELLKNAIQKKNIKWWKMGITLP